MTRRSPLLFLAAVLLIPPAAGCEEPFSIVSMTLHDEALARAHDVALSGDLAFVPGKGQSLAIIDLGNPAEPEILWFMNDPALSDSETVLPVGNHLLLGTQDFLTLDVANPAKPVILKTISDRPRIDRINGMIRIGDIAIAANKSGYIDAFDISDIRNPTLFGALETEKQFGLEDPHDIDRSGDHIVIVDPARFSPPEGRLGVFKVAKNGKVLPLKQWKLVGKTAGESLIGANRVQVFDDYAIVGGSFRPEVRASFERETGREIEPSLVVVDLSDPAHPTILAHLPFPDERGPNGLTIAGKVAFLAGGQTVAAYDISKPEKPSLIASQRFPIYRKAERTDNYHDLVYRDGLLFISAQSDNGFLILKVEDETIRTLANGD